MSNLTDDGGGSSGNSGNSTSTSTTSGGFIFPSINFGNNLVEIGAITTLIGSTIAETLVFGDRGSAGLVWGMMSVFGNTSVIRACINGASPGWARTLLGLRNSASDAAVGLDLDLAHDSRGVIRVRGMSDVPVGVSCEHDESKNETDLMDVPLASLSKEHPSCRDIYAFDRSTTVMLDALPGTPLGDSLTVYTYGSYPFWRSDDTRFQVSALAVSLLKLLEVWHQWASGAPLLALASAIPFTFFFLVACVIEAHAITLARRPAEVGNLDIIAGALPTTKRPGGEKKVALGVMHNPRRSIWWKLVWSVGGSLHTASLVASYFLLNQQPTVFVLTWAAFQVTWLAFRVLIYYFANTLEPMSDRMMVGHQWKDLDSSHKARVLTLALAVAKYQTHVHPRDAQAYRGDSFSSLQISRLLGGLGSLHLTYELPSSFDTTISSTVKVNIVAVIGDTALSSAAWMTGSKSSPMDLYDNCIVVFSLSPPPPPAPGQSSAYSGFRTIAIPSARVLSGIPVQPFEPPDPEKRMPIFVPRGAGSRGGYSRTWWYWIPCSSGRWLQIRSERLTVLGQCSAEVVDDGQLSILLGAGNLNICLAHADEVKEIVRTSQTAAEHLLSLLH